MSYFVAYVVSQKGRPRDGDQVASGWGWLSWGEFVLSRADCPHAVHLAEEGWTEPSAFAALEKELSTLNRVDADPDVLGVNSSLLKALRARPRGCLGLIVTDGAG